MFTRSLIFAPRGIDKVYNEVETLSNIFGGFKYESIFC